MGVEEGRAARALKACGGSVEAAVEYMSEDV
jgi:hypothetical protein